VNKSTLTVDPNERTLCPQLPSLERNIVLLSDK
jgi:hypothetical protein